MTSTETRVAFTSRPDTYDAWHFAEANRVGDTIWVSGQRGYDADDRISEDPAEQARVALANLGATLRQAGADFTDIVDITSYHTDMADVAAFRAAKDEVIPAPYPSWTVIGVAALAEPEMKVEVQVVAVIGSGRGARVVRT